MRQKPDGALLIFSSCYWLDWPSVLLGVLFLLPQATLLFSPEDCTSAACYICEQGGAGSSEYG